MVVTSSTLSEELGEQKTVGLSTLERTGAQQVTYCELAHQFRCAWSPPLVPKHFTPERFGQITWEKRS